MLRLVDDVTGKTISLLHLQEIKTLVLQKVLKTEIAAAVGKAVAEKAIKAGVETVAFDRNVDIYTTVE